jgi:hypothetical protein
MNDHNKFTESGGSTEVMGSTSEPKGSRVITFSESQPEAVPPWGAVNDEFPLESFPTFVQEYVNKMTRGYAVPVEVIALAALGTLSGAMGKGWRLSGVVPNKHNFGNLYIVASLPPSSGKNSVDDVVAPMRNFEKRRRKQWEEEKRPSLLAIKEAKEAQLMAARKPNSKSALSQDQQNDLKKQICKLEKQLKWCPDLLAGDDTSAHLIQKVQYATDETLCVFSSEGGDVVQTMLGRFQEKGADMKFCLKAYSGDSHRSGRVHSGGVNIDKPILTVCLFVQPYVWAEILANKEADGCGLLPRILVSQSFNPMPFDHGEAREIPRTLTDEWEKLITDILERRVNRSGNGQTCENTPQEVQCSTEAVEIFRDLYNEAATLANGACADLRADLGRWRENAARLALVLAVAENPDCLEVTSDQAAKAAKILKWFAVRGFETRYEMRDAALEARKVRLEGLLKKSGNRLALRTLEKNNSFSSQEIGQIVSKFPERFRIEERKNANGGRPSNQCVLIEVTQ